MSAKILQSDLRLFSKKNTDYLIILLIIIFSGSLYYSSFYHETYTRNFYVFPFLIFLFMVCLHRSINYSQIGTLYLLFTIVIILSTADDDLKTEAVYVAVLISAFLFISIMPFERFSEIYVNIILILSVISWFSLLMPYFKIYSPVPNFFDLFGARYENYIFFGIPTFNIDHGISRSNCGIFWEPGAWQVFVNTGFVLAMVNRIITLKRYLIFLITNLTIVSTTGLIFFLLLSIVFFSSMNIVHRKKKIGLFIFLGAIISVILNDYFSNIFDKFNVANMEYGSLVSRLNDNMVDLHIFMEHPLNGVGIGNWEARKFYSNELGIDPGYGSDGIVKLISEVGIFGIAIVLPLIFPRYLISFALLQRLIICFSFILIFNTQGMMIYLFPWILTFYGLKRLVIFTNPMSDQPSVTTL